MSKLRPFRDYDEHDVLNLFALNADVALPVVGGTLVELDDAKPWKNDDEDGGIEMLGNGSELTFNNVTHERYGVKAKVKVCGASALPLGMLLYDVRDVDENGEKLHFLPRKAAENDWIISGQAAPVVAKGVFLYDGGINDSSTAVAGTLMHDHHNATAVTPGAALFVAAAGELSTAGTHQVGIALGTPDVDGNVLIRLHIA